MRTLGSPSCPSGAVGWPSERALFALAGTITLTSAVLAAAVSSWLLLLTGVVGVNRSLYVVAGSCAASSVLPRLFGLRSLIYVKEVVR